jgi:hypothetical protein
LENESVLCLHTFESQKPENIFADNKTQRKQKYLYNYDCLNLNLNLSLNNKTKLLRMDFAYPVVAVSFNFVRVFEMGLKFESLKAFKLIAIKMKTYEYKPSN